MAGFLLFLKSIYIYIVFTARSGHTSKPYRYGNHGD